VVPVNLVIVLKHIVNDLYIKLEPEMR
jgi:hypothetical protein